LLRGPTLRSKVDDVAVGILRRAVPISPISIRRFLKDRDPLRLQGSDRGIGVVNVECYFEVLPRCEGGITRVEKEPNITGLENDSPFLVGRERQP
jgi:hypothetical protein